MVEFVVIAEEGTGKPTGHNERLVGVCRFVILKMLEQSFNIKIGWTMFCTSNVVA